MTFAKAKKARKASRSASVPVSSIHDDSANYELELRLAAEFSANHCLSISSGSQAIVTALLACDVGSGDEVILGPVGWGQALAAVVLVGATPVIVDCDSMGGIDPDAARAAISNETRAILTVCPNGIADDLKALGAVARDEGIRLINDASQASRLVASSPADVHCLSLGISKLIAAGEGGVIVTDDSTLFERAAILSQHPLRAHREVLDSEHFAAISEFFLSSRMSPLHARIAIAACDRLAKRTHRRKVIARRLSMRLDTVIAAASRGRIERPKPERVGDLTRVVRCFHPASNATSVTALRESLIQLKGIGESVCDPERLLTEKLLAAGSQWRSVLTQAAAQRLRVCGDLPRARDYCDRLVMADCAIADSHGLGEWQ